MPQINKSNYVFSALCMCPCEDPELSIFFFFFQMWSSKKIFFFMLEWHLGAKTISSFFSHVLVLRLPNCQHYQDKSQHILQWKNNSLWQYVLLEKYTCVCDLLYVYCATFPILTSVPVCHILFGGIFKMCIKLFDLYWMVVWMNGPVVWCMYTWSIF